MRAISDWIFAVLLLVSISLSIILVMEYKTGGSFIYVRFEPSTFHPYFLKSFWFWVVYCSLNLFLFIYLFKCMKKGGKC